MIGRQTEILGDIRFAGGLHVDGRVKGKVLTSGEKASSLSVSENGTIEGDVRVPNIVLNGTVVGDVHASEKITMAAKARVTGNVYYKVIEMEAGAQINGQLVHESHSAASIDGLEGEMEFDELGEARRVKGFITG
nr:polymer-forming cytoskeletal protein [Solimonas marina]